MGRKCFFQISIQSSPSTTLLVVSKVPTAIFPSAFLESLARSWLIAFATLSLSLSSTYALTSAPVAVEEVSALEPVKNLNLDVVKGLDFGGGIKLLGQKTDKDLSFNAILAQFASTNAQKVSAIIFK